MMEMRAWGKKRVRSCGVLLAMVRSLDFTGKAVEETRGFKVGYRRFSSRVRADCRYCVEDLQRQTCPAGRQCRRPTPLSGLHGGQPAANTRCGVIPSV